MMWYSLLGFAVMCYAIEGLVGPVMGPAAILLVGIVVALAVTQMTKKKNAASGGFKVKLD